MIPHLRPACFALGLVALATPAAAQNWVYENGTRWSPAGAPTYTVTPVEPYAATTTQRTVIDRTIIPQGPGRQPIVRERVVTDTYAPGVTVAQPAAAPLAANAYAYVPAPVYTPAPAYTPRDDRYVYGPRYVETVTDAYAYVPPAPATEAYAYVPNGAAGPRLVTTVTTVRDTAYCARRYRSYDAVSGTFLGFDGLRHACP
jgi:hypothetical protein